MDFHRKLVVKEFRTTSVKIFLQPLIFTELVKDFITYEICTFNDKKLKALLLRSITLI